MCTTATVGVMCHTAAMRCRTLDTIPAAALMCVSASSSLRPYLDIDIRARTGRCLEPGLM